MIVNGEEVKNRFSLQVFYLKVLFIHLFIYYLFERVSERGKEKQLARSSNSCLTPHMTTTAGTTLV